MSHANPKFKPTHEQEALKNAFARAIDLVGSGRRMSEVLGYSENQVSRWKHHHYDEHLPAALHSKVDAAAGQPCLLEAQASLSGFSIRREEAQPTVESAISLAASMAELSARAVRTTVEVKADNIICQRDVNIVEAEAKTIKQNVDQWVEAIRAKFDAGARRMTGAAR